MTKDEAVTVSDLIKHLSALPQDLPVAYQCYSEWCLLSLDELSIEKGQLARPDGWVHSPRSDKPSQDYLIFPGN